MKDTSSRKKSLQTNLPEDPIVLKGKDQGDGIPLNLGIKLIQSSVDGIVAVDEKGNVLLFSKGAERLWGYTREEVVRRIHIEELYPPGLARDVNMRLAEPGPNGPGRLVDYETEILNKQGKRVHVRISGSLFQDEGSLVRSVGYFHDMTREKQIMDQLVESEEKYRSILETIEDGYCEIDLEGNLTFFNKSFCRILGYSEDELMGKNLREFSDEEEAKRAYEGFNKVFTTGVHAKGFEWGMNRKDGSKIYVASSISLIKDPEGEIVGFQGITRDITEHKLRGEALKRAKEEAESANIAKSEFLANMSHEIRTPMNGIIGMTELALGSTLTREQREYLQMVKMSADSLLALLNSVLDLAKIESRKIELDEIDFDLRTTVENAVQTVAVKAGEIGLELICRIRPDVPTALVGDPSRLRQILLNLLGNAIKFTHKGDVSLDVRIEAEDDSSVLLHFIVSDTGIGIPPDKLDAVFESFQQADGSITREYEGTGLGLTISKELVELMGGGIWVESVLGKGSTFHFTARFGLSDMEITDSLSLKDQDIAGMRVLIVDDNATNRLVFHEMTSLWGLEPTEVEGGEHAVAELERAHDAGRPYKLILLDLQMPELDGFEVAKRIRENPVGSDLEILMLTSLGMKGDAERCKEVGIGVYLVKPVKQAELLEGIMLTLGRPRKDKGPVITRHTIQDIRRRLKILLAEDNIVNQKLALKMLEKRGHHVTIVSNGLEALDALDVERFDLVLMDVQMPHMDGLEATKHVRDSEKEDEHIPIIAMTAHAMKGDREMCLSAGMDDYVSKPIMADELFSVIERVSGQFLDRDEKQILDFL
jgi:two-component system sensor histidine kinase/response regulator